MRRLYVIFVLGLAALLLAPAARAAGNDTCARALDYSTRSNTTLVGSLRPATPEFYKFAGTPGADLELFVRGQAFGRLGVRGIVYPYAAVLDSQCRQLATTADDQYHDAKTKVRFTVPADGIYIVDITSCCSLEHGGTEQGGYVARVAPYTPPPVVSGRVTDAAGQPLAWSPVQMFQCQGPGYTLCSEWVTQAYTDDDGRYSMETQYLDQYASFQLTVNDWTTHSNAPQRSRPFTLNAAALTLDFVMQPLPVVLESTIWGSGNVPLGSTAYLTATLRNPSLDAQKLDVWLAVDARVTGEEGSASWYQRGRAGQPEPVTLTLAPGQTMEVPLAFTPPPASRSGSSGALLVVVSRAGEPTNSLVNTWDVAYQVLPGGTSVALQAGAPVKAARAREQAQRRLSLQRQLKLAAAPAATVNISGGVRYADGSPQATALVALYRCPGPGYDYCNSYVGDTATDAAGRYSLAVDAAAAGGSFQVVALDWGSSYGPGARSASFTLATGAATMDIVMQPWTLNLSQVAWDKAEIPLGGTAQLNFTLSNKSGRALSLDAWLRVEAGPTGSMLGWSLFQRGGTAGQAQPLRLSLAAGETRSFTLPFATPPGALSGSAGMVSLYVGEAGAPTSTYAREENLHYEITPRKTAALRAGDDVKTLRWQQQQRERDALLRTATAGGARRR